MQWIVLKYLFQTFDLFKHSIRAISWMQEWNLHLDPFRISWYYFLRIVRTPMLNGQWQTQWIPNSFLFPIRQEIIVCRDYQLGLRIQWNSFRLNRNGWSHILCLVSDSMPVDCMSTKLTTNKSIWRKVWKMFALNVQQIVIFVI